MKSFFPYLALGLGVLCIGSSAVFVRLAGVPGPVSALYRMGISALVLTLPIFLQRQRQWQEMTNPLLTITIGGGVWYAVENALYNQGILLTTAANAVLLVNLSVIWVALGASLIFREKLSPIFWVGALPALVGAILVTRINVFALETPRLGDLLAVASSFFYAAYILTTQKARATINTIQYLWLTMIVASILLLCTNLVVGNELIHYSPKTFFYLALLALIGQVIGFGAINFAQGYIPATKISVFLLGQPVVTLLLAALVLGENPTWQQAVGMLFTLIGVYIVSHYYRVTESAAPAVQAGAD